MSNRQLRSLLVVVVAVVAVVMLTAGTATAETEIEECTVLDQPGETYQLADDITDRSATHCLEITADGITVDGVGYTVDGVDRENDNSIGILNEDADDVTVENVDVSGWYTGIELKGDNNTLRDSEIIDNDWKGVYVVGEFATVTGNTVTGNDWDAIDYHPLSNNGTITENEVSGNRDGISVVSDGVTIADNIARDNDFHGITIVSGTENSIESNIVESNGLGGLRTWAAEGNTFTNNIARDNGDTNVELLSGSHNNTLTDTLVRNGGNADVRINDSAGNEIKNLDIGLSTAENTTISVVDGNGVLLSATDSPPAHPGAAGIDRFVTTALSHGAEEGFVELAVHYEDGDLTGLDETELALWHHDGQWSELDSTVYPSSNQVVAEITEFATVGIFSGNPVVSDADGPGFNTEEDADDSTDDPADDGSTAGDGADDAGDDSADDNDADDDGAGFGVLAALLAISGTVLVLQRETERAR